MKTTASFKIFITKSPDAAAMIAKGLWEESIKVGTKISVGHGCVGPDKEFIPQIYEGLYYAYVQYITADENEKYELILC